MIEFDLREHTHFHNAVGPQPCCRNNEQKRGQMVTIVEAAHFTMSVARAEENENTINRGRELSQNSAFSKWAKHS